MHREKRQVDLFFFYRLRNASILLLLRNVKKFGVTYFKGSLTYSFSVAKVLIFFIL